MGQTALSWFDISDQRVAEIWAAVREELPVTEALLIGNPQSGKSCLVPKGRSKRAEGRKGMPCHIRVSALANR